MKKLLLIASALLAFSFFGCDQPSNSTTPDTGKSDIVVDSGDDTTKDDDTTGDDTTGDDTTGDDTTGDDTTGDDTTGDDTTGDDTTGDEVTEVVIFDTPQEKSGDVNNFDITATKFAEYIASGKNTIVFTLLNSADVSRSTWGVLALISAETVSPWKWHNLADNTDLGTNKYGQLAIANFSSGATGEIEVSLELLANAVKAEGETNKLVLQTSNDALLQSVKIK